MNPTSPTPHTATGQSPEQGNTPSAGSSLQLPPRPLASERHVSSKKIDSVFRFDRACLEAMRQAFLNIPPGDQVHVERFENPHQSGGRDYILKVSTEKFDAMRSIRVRPHNREHGLPSSISDITLYNGNGELLYTLPGTTIGAAKTAVMSSLVAEKWATLEGIRSFRVGIVGAGKIAESHITALSSFFPQHLESVVVHSRSGSAKKLVETLSSQPDISHSEDLSFLKDCNLIIAATNSGEATIALEDLGRNLLRNKKLLVGVGYNDIDPRIFDLAERDRHGNRSAFPMASIVSEHIDAYCDHEMPRPLKVWAEESQGRRDRVTNLSDYLRLQNGQAAKAVTLFMPFGIALGDLALSLDVLRRLKMPHIS